MFSIIMPVWNRADFVTRAIDSVLAQTFTNYELLIIDDGSNDNLKEVVKPYLSEKVSYHHISHQGVSTARNFGLRKAKRPFIAYLDSDNTWHPEFLENTYQALQSTQSPYRAAYCMSKIFRKDSTNGKVYLDGTMGKSFSFIKLLAECYIDLNTFSHSREILEYAGMFDEQLKNTEDWDLIIRITSLVKPVFIPKILVDYYLGLADNTLTLTEDLDLSMSILRNKYSFFGDKITYLHDTIPYTWENLSDDKVCNFWVHDNQKKLNTSTYSAWGYPFMLQIEPTNACNLECPLCPVGRKELGRETKHMSFEMFKSIIDDLQNYLLFLVLWDWGEPFMNPELPKMIKYASGRDIRTVTSTNAHFLDNALFLKEILTSGLTTLIIAIDSLQDETYQVYRKKGSLNKAVAGLKKVVEMKKRLGSKTRINMRMVIMKQNEHELGRLRKLARKVGVDWFTVKTLNPSCGDVALDSELVPQKPKYQRFEYTPDTNQRIRVDTVCRRPWVMTNIFSNGDVVPCCYDYNSEMKVGNVAEKPLSEIWNSSAFCELRRKIYNEKDSITKCRNCWVSFKLSKNGWFPEYEDLTVGKLERLKNKIPQQIKDSFAWSVLRAAKRSL